VHTVGYRPLEAHGLHFYSYWSIRRLLRKAGSATRAWRVRPEEGASTDPGKRLAKRALSALGIPHQALLPHVMLVLEPIDLG
jgi:hypothetical protein